MTYSKERDEAVLLKITRSWVRKLSPDLLERSHLLSSDGLRSTDKLEDIRETLDDHT